MNLPSSPAIHLVYNTRTTISDPGDSFRRFWELEEPHQVSVLLQKSSKQLITLTAPIPGILMASLPRKVLAVTLGSSRD